MAFPDAVKFKKGVSGNPGGKPKGTINLTTALKLEFKEGLIKPRDFVARMIALAMEGNGTAIKEVWLRYDGAVDANVNLMVSEDASQAFLQAVQAAEKVYGKERLTEFLAILKQNVEEPEEVEE